MDVFTWMVKQLEKMMSSIPESNKLDQTPIYEIRIKGQLDQEWADWFEGMTLSLEEDGNTLISGPVVDQSALYASLKRVHQLGLKLISVNQIEREIDKGWVEINQLKNC